MTTEDATDAAVATPTGRRPRLQEMTVPLIVASALFMEMLDGSIIVLALPQMARTFGVTPTGITLGITAYMAALAAFVPLSGWAADRIGPRNLFASAIALFVLASVGCGLSGGLPSFVAARVVQGAAAAMMSPVGRLVVMRTTAKKNLIAAVGIITWPALIAPVVGPPLGGMITTLASWRWIFFLNVPIGMIGVALVLRFMPRATADDSAPFDTVGFLLTALAMGLLIYGLDLAGKAPSDLRLWPLVILVALAAGTAAYRHAKTGAGRLIDLRPVALQSFRMSALTAGLWGRVAVNAPAFLLPLMFQLAYGLNAYRAGIMVLVYMGGNLAMKSVTTPIMHRFGFRSVLVINGLITGAMTLACGQLRPDVAAVLLYGTLFVAGLSRSLVFTALTTLGFADIKPEWSGSATAMMSSAIQLAFTLSVAVPALVLNLSQKARGGGALDVKDFQAAFLVMALISLGSSLWFLRLHRDAGAALRDRGA